MKLFTSLNVLLEGQCIHGCMHFIFGHRKMPEILIFLEPLSLTPDRMGTLRVDDMEC